MYSDPLNVSKRLLYVTQLPLLVIVSEHLALLLNDKQITIASIGVIAFVQYSKHLLPSAHISALKTNPSAHLSNL